MSGHPDDPNHTAVEQHHVRSMLRAHGLRCTTPRMAVLSALDRARDRGHLTVAQIGELIAATGIDVDLTTVYRTVATLTDSNILHALVVDERVTSYGLTDSPHHHAICTNCGAMIEVPAAQLDAALAHASIGSQFSLPDTAGMTLHGLCPSCQRDR